MQRRTFIQSLAIGAATFAAGDVFAEAKKARNYGVQLYTVRQPIAKDLEKTLTQLKSMGYDKVELFGYDGKFFGKTAQEFKQILNNTGLKAVSSHHMSGLGMKAKGSISEGWDQAIEDMHTVGAEYMVCAFLFPNERTAENYAKLPDMFNKAGEKAKAAKIQFAYHNHDFEFEKYGDSTVMDHLIIKTSPDLVKMELDLYWISKTGNDPVAYFNKYPGRFPLWHVKDMEKGTNGITEVGNGVIDFDRIFAARKKAGLKHWFVEQDVSKGDIFESLKTSHSYLDGKKYKV
jgi:sugar phosphate isomerase/epimerase